jgi:hypothetical protein
VSTRTSVEYRSASGVVDTHLSRLWLPCRGQKHVLANDDIAASIDSHIDEAAPRLPSTNITALAMRPLTAMHTWAVAVNSDRDRDAVLAEDLSPMESRNEVCNNIVKAARASLAVCFIVPLSSVEAINEPRCLNLSTTGDQHPA